MKRGRDFSCAILGLALLLGVAPAEEPRSDRPPKETLSHTSGRTTKELREGRRGILDEDSYRIPSNQTAFYCDRARNLLYVAQGARTVRAEDRVLWIVVGQCDSGRGARKGS